MLGSVTLERGYLSAHSWAERPPLSLSPWRPVSSGLTVGMPHISCLCLAIGTGAKHWKMGHLWMILVKRNWQEIPASPKPKLDGSPFHLEASHDLEWKHNSCSFLSLNVQVKWIFSNLWNWILVFLLFSLNMGCHRTTLFSVSYVCPWICSQISTVPCLSSSSIWKLASLFILDYLQALPLPEGSPGSSIKSSSNCFFLVFITLEWQRSKMPSCPSVFSSPWMKLSSLSLHYLTCVRLRVSEWNTSHWSYSIWETQGKSRNGAEIPRSQSL